jgi:hypothetical protein
MKTVKDPYLNREWYYRGEEKVSTVYTVGTYVVATEPGVVAENTRQMVIVRKAPTDADAVLIPLETFEKRVVCPRYLKDGDLAMEDNHGAVVGVYRVTERDRVHVLFPVDLHTMKITPQAAAIEVPRTLLTSEGMLDVEGARQGSIFCYISARQGLNAVKYEIERERLRQTAVQLNVKLNAARWRTYSPENLDKVRRVSNVLEDLINDLPNDDGQDK